MLAIRSVKFDHCIAVARFALFSEALLLAHAEAAAGNPQPATQAAQAAVSRSAHPGRTARRARSMWPEARSS